MTNVEKLDPMKDGASLDIVVENIHRMKELFPEVFTEDRVDFDALREVLGEYVEDCQERYSFTWHGKSTARRIAQTPSTGTLRPCPEESVSWDTTQNLFIEGDNLEVLKLLQKSYYDSVKLIYIDPPYNTGKEFIYPDRYQDNLDTYLRYTRQVSAEGLKLSSNAETSGRYHTNWLNMIFPRLKLARNLLTEDGVIMISINDVELANLRKLCDEIFGEEAFVGNVVWKGATDNNPTRIAVEHEYILCYCKNPDAASPVWQNTACDAKEVMLTEFDRLKLKYGTDSPDLLREYRKFVRDNSAVLVPLTHYTQVDASGPYTGSRKVHNPKPGGYRYDVIHPETGGVCVPPVNGYRYPESRLHQMIEDGRILFGADESQVIQVKEYLSEFKAKLSSVITLDSRAGANELGRLFGNRKVFTNPKPFELLTELFGFVLGPDDILLDFFAGSAASAQAVLEMNAADGGRRRFIMVQLPEALDDSKTEHAAAIAFCREKGLAENIAEISKERIRRVLQKITEAPGRSDPDALGLRVFRLDSSNLVEWDPSGGPLEQAMLDVTERWKPDRSPADVFYELLLKYGLDLGVSTNEVTVGESGLFVAAGATLIVCLSSSVDERTSADILDVVEQYKPEVTRVVLRESGFATDTVKTNVLQMLRVAGIEDVKSI